MELERGKALPPKDFIASLENRELDLIEPLNKNGAEGVIGLRSRLTLHRKPSSIYWNALRTYGLFTEPVTLSEYAALLYARLGAADLQKSGGKRKARDEDDTNDDNDAGQAGTSFWRVPFPDTNWGDNITIELTTDEAVFLREKILSMPKTRDSLFPSFMDRCKNL